MNKYRLTTNVHLLKNKEYISILEIENLLTTLYLSDSPYEISFHLDPDRDQGENVLRSRRDKVY
jgi:hypothetical protein